MRYFKYRFNSQSPVLAVPEYEAEAMVKHAEYYECDPDGKPLKAGEIIEDRVPILPADRSHEQPVEQPAEQPAEPKARGKK